MVMDYALGTAIVGLNPFQSWLTVTLCIALALILKMLWDIRRKWHLSGGYNVLAIASYLFNISPTERRSRTKLKRINHEISRFLESIKAE